MKAAMVSRYGGPEVARIKEMPKPTPGKNQLLVRVMYAAVTAGDSRIRGARFPKGFAAPARLAFGLRGPRVGILGGTYSGIVEAAGPGVTGYKVGDAVCGMTGIKLGTHAEYVVVNATKGITKKPNEVSHKDAAGLLFGGTAALYFVRDKLCVQSGDTVCVNGASGAVGTNAVQLAAYFGGIVNGVTSSENGKLVQKLGATTVIDYAKQPLAASGQRFDALIDAVGNITPAQAKQLLTPTGRAALMVASFWDTVTARGAIKTGTASEKAEDMAFLLSLVAEGKIRVMIDSVYPLEDIAQAYARVDGGSKVGNVLLAVGAPVKDETPGIELE